MAGLDFARGYYTRGKCMRTVTTLRLGQEGTKERPTRFWTKPPLCSVSIPRRAPRAREDYGVGCSTTLSGRRNRMSWIAGPPAARLPAPDPTGGTPDPDQRLGEICNSGSSPPEVAGTRSGGCGCYGATLPSVWSCCLGWSEEEMARYDDRGLQGAWLRTPVPRCRNHGSVDAGA